MKNQILSSNVDFVYVDGKLFADSTELERLESFLLSHNTYFEEEGVYLLDFENPTLVEVEQVDLVENVVQFKTLVKNFVSPKLKIQRKGNGFYFEV
jgi:hypothetical protein